MLDRQFEGELAPLPHFAINPYSASVQLDHLLGDSKAQAGATSLSGTGIIRPVETLEYMRQVVLRNTNTLICYLYNCKSVLFSGYSSDSAIE